MITANSENLNFKIFWPKDAIRVFKSHAVNLTGHTRQDIASRYTQKERMDTCRFCLVYFLCGSLQRFQKVVFVVVGRSILHMYSVMQEKELLNIWCGRRLCCQWGFCICILPHRKRNCRWTTATVSLLGQIKFLNDSKPKNSFYRYQNWRK